MPWIEVDGIEMMECDYCHNVWDGNAQCNCWGGLGIDDEYEEGLYYAGAEAGAGGYDSGYDE